MKTVTEMVTWLNTPGHIKCVLADITEVGNSEVSNFFLSNVAYFGDNQNYNAAITGGLSFSESLNVDGQASISFGSLEIVNTNGIHDAYLTYVWSKRPIKVYLGDPSWPKSDFVLIFDGLIQEITAPGENALSFTLFDKLQRLNDPISERTLADTNYSQNTLKNVLPLLFGEAFNIQPLLVDKGGASGIPGVVATSTTTSTITGVTSTTSMLVGQVLTKVSGTGNFGTNPTIVNVDSANSQITITSTSANTAGSLTFNVGGVSGAGQTYMIHDGAINGLIEARDSGVPITVTENNSSGTFTLLTSPVGTITCSAQGRTTYTNTVPGIIRQIVTNYGTTANRFTDSEISFDDFTNASAVGFYSSDRTNILDACNQLAKSLNANLICPSIVVTNGVVSASKLRLVEIKAPAGTVKYTLSDDNMILNSLSIQQMFSVKPSIKLGYCKNYTIQTTVSGGVNPESRFDEPYIYLPLENNAKKTLYRDSGTVAEEETLLLTTAGATAEAEKRLTLWEKQRYVVTADYLPHLMFVQLGDIVRVKSARFGLTTEELPNGTLGMVYSVTRNWTTGIVSIGVLV
jgi:hypothetical protein